MSGNVIGYKKAFLAHLTGLLPNIIPVSLLKSRKKGRFSKPAFPQKWLVLTRPSLAGFNRPLTISAMFVTIGSFLKPIEAGFGSFELRSSGHACLTGSLGG